MARLADREKAIELRLKGKSYSEIKRILSVGKGTLSAWLAKYPLSKERLFELQGGNQARIERFRNTMQLKRETRQHIAYEKVRARVGTLTPREFYLAGLFLYWAEGTKMTRYTVALTNTDPSMLRFFIKWLSALGVPQNKLKARLHLYTDMHIEKQTLFWAKELELPRSVFKNTYIKNSDSTKRRNYKGRFGHGTCSVWVGGRDLSDQVLMGVKVLEDMFGKIAPLKF
jgi:hypothetical protein